VFKFADKRNMQYINRLVQGQKRNLKVKVKLTKSCAPRC